MRWLLERARFLVLIAVVGLLLASAATFVWGFAKSVEVVRVLLKDGGWRGSAALVELLEVMDTFLTGTVLVIFAVGLYELFVADIQVPDWLVIHDLSTLKGKLSDVIILVLALKFLEAFVTKKDALDVLYLGASVALVGGVLIAFNLVRNRH